MKNVEHLQDDSCKINSTFITGKHSKHTELILFFYTSKKPHTAFSFVCVSVCVYAPMFPNNPSEMCAFPACPGVFQPHDALTFDCGDDVEVLRVFTDPVILFRDRQNQSIKRLALHLHIPGTSPHFRIRDHSVIQPNLINKCSSPVPQQSQMKMLLCGTEQSDKDRTAARRSPAGPHWQLLYTEAAMSLLPG